MSKQNDLQNYLVTYEEVNPEIGEPLVYRVIVQCPTTGEDIFDEEIRDYWMEQGLDRLASIVERHQELNSQVL